MIEFKQENCHLEIKQLLFFDHTSISCVAWITKERLMKNIYDKFQKLMSGDGGHCPHDGES